MPTYFLQGISLEHILFPLSLCRLWTEKSLVQHADRDHSLANVAECFRRGLILCRTALCETSVSLLLQNNLDGQIAVCHLRAFQLVPKRL